MKKVFIDGSEGTTGLRIFERFQVRDDIELLKIDSDKRKDPEEIKKFINASDITFLCLPDAAAREAVELCDNPDTVKSVLGSEHNLHQRKPAFGQSLCKWQCSFLFIDG